MAHKVVGTGTTVAISVGAGETSIPISLQTGYLRIATSVAAHVSIAATATEIASRNNYFVPSTSDVILKDRVASSRVSAATTGTSTTYTFDQNNGNPFLVGDFVTVTGSSVGGYNCSHQLITSSNTTPGSESVTVSFNSSATTTAFTGSADVRRSVVVNTFGNAAGYAQISQVQIVSQA
jgi:hypothetical protein